MGGGVMFNEIVFGLLIAFSIYDIFGFIVHRFHQFLKRSESKCTLNRCNQCNALFKPLYFKQQKFCSALCAGLYDQKWDK